VHEEESGALKTHTLRLLATSRLCMFGVSIFLSTPHGSCSYEKKNINGLTFMNIFSFIFLIDLIEHRDKL
jgi:hypothetical protein